MRLRRARIRADLEPGERILAASAGPAGQVVATTYRLHLPTATLEWNRIETASWRGEDQALAVVEVATSSARNSTGPRRHQVPVDQPTPLVDVVREQVTASVVISRRVTVDGRRRVRVTGRRDRYGNIAWTAALDPGLDIADPTTRSRVEAAVALVRGEVE